MESPCLVNSEPAYDLPAFPTDPTSSVGNRVTREIQLQGNVAYSSADTTWEDDSFGGTATANNTYEEVRNGTVPSTILANEVLTVRENLHATHCSQESLPLQSNSKDRFDNIIFFERRKTFGECGRRGKLTWETTIALTALLSILIAGTAIAFGVMYKFLWIPSSNGSSQAQNETTLSDQCYCEWKSLISIA